MTPLGGGGEGSPVARSGGGNPTEPALAACSAAGLHGRTDVHLGVRHVLHGAVDVLRVRERVRSVRKLDLGRLAGGGDHVLVALLVHDRARLGQVDLDAGARGGAPGELGAEPELVGCEVGVVALLHTSPLLVADTVVVALLDAVVVPVRVVVPVGDDADQGGHDGQDHRADDQGLLGVGVHCQPPFLLRG